MFPTVNGKAIPECTEADLQVLIDNPDYRENEYLDYKRRFSFLEVDKSLKQEHISEFRSDVCAFANADGGYLIFGISEKKGIPSEILGVDIPGNNTDKFELERKNNLQTILPKIPSVKFHFIPLENGKYVVILQILKDGFSPYIHLEGEKNYLIYKRIGNGKASMSYSEIQLQFTQSLNLEREIAQFRRQRIDYFRANEDDDYNSYSKFAMVHIIPDTFLDRTHNKNIYVLNQTSKNSLSTVFQPFDCSGNPRPNVDGLHFCGYKSKREGQIWNSGTLELFLPLNYEYLVSTQRSQHTRDLFTYPSFWDNFKLMVNQYLSTFADLLDTKRVFVCYSLIGCKGIRTNANDFDERMVIDRTQMIGNPVVFDNIRDEESNSQAMKRMNIEYKLSLGIHLSPNEIMDIENG